MARKKRSNGRNKNIPSMHTRIIQRRLQFGGLLQSEAAVAEMSSNHLLSLLEDDKRNGYGVFTHLERQHLAKAQAELAQAQRRLAAVGKRAASDSTIDQA